MIIRTKEAKPCQLCKFVSFSFITLLIKSQQGRVPPVLIKKQKEAKVPRTSLSTKELTNMQSGIQLEGWGRLYFIAYITEVNEPIKLEYHHFEKGFQKRNNLGSSCLRGDSGSTTTPTRNSIFLSGQHLFHKEINHPSHCIKQRFTEMFIIITKENPFSS